jgi:Complex 1 protein (LYR family)
MKQHNPSHIKQTTLHLFRALLRASSYLPDEFARAYIRNHISYRFRIASSITPARLQTARRVLSTLQRANNGAVAPLKKVLKHAYGRAGKRRQELVSIFEQLRRNPLSEKVLNIAQKRLGIDRVKDPLAYQTLLLSFMRSQAWRSGAGEARGKIRHFEPQIPEENIWGRPIAHCRRRNITRKFWTSTLKKLLPPLPEAEWNRLRDLATGAIPFRGAPPRRSHHLPTEKAFLSPSNLKLPIHRSARELLEPSHRIDQQHHIKARFMRRLWGDIWQETPKVCYDNENAKWAITWGGGHSAESRGVLSIPGRKDLELFEGIHLSEARASPRV